MTNNDQQNNTGFFKGSGGRVLITVISALIIWGLMFLFIMYLDFAPVTLIIAGVCAFFGWRALNRIQPSMFIWMPLAGWFFYIFIKFFLAMVIGLFVAPFIIGRRFGGNIHDSIQ